MGDEMVAEQVDCGERASLESGQVGDGRVGLDAY
jgi:hypothetical protein